MSIDFSENSPKRSVTTIQYKSSKNQCIVHPGRLARIKMKVKFLN